MFVPKIIILLGDIFLNEQIKFLLGVRLGDRQNLIFLSVVPYRHINFYFLSHLNKTVLLIVNYANLLQFQLNYH